ncbi:MAG: phosphoribosylamine--glycine ligase, partial [Bacteroidales bacterium]|nr:phosphoribosylamine--glycine ligase [Bacteroidales bacterium]
MKRVLITGSGGREHALAFAVSKSPLLEKLFCAPGNPGTASIAENIPINVTDFESIASFIKEHKIDVVVVGPENPLVEGLRDYLENNGVLDNRIFVGPGREGARLEGSKEFAKEFMSRWSIPTARFRTFERGGVEEAVEFLKTLSPPYVLKADGLAAGKGVVI